MRLVQGAPLVLALCAGAAFAGGRAQAGNFVYTAIDVPGANATYPLNVNEHGDVAGVYTISQTSPQYGFVWSNGTITTFTAELPTQNVAVAGIDNHGAVALTTGHPRGGSSSAVVRHPGGGLTRLPTPAGAAAWAEGINGMGQIVGGYEAGAGSTSRTGFLFYKGKLQDIVFPGAALTTPAGIARDGTVAGTYSAGFADPARGFTYLNGAYQSFDPPGSTYTIVNSINAHGVIAGTFYTADLGTGTLGYVFSGGAFHIYALKRGRDYVNEVKWAGPDHAVAGDFYNLVNTIAFTHVHGQYYQMLPFGAANSYIYSGNGPGTLVGLYWGTDNVTHGFVAVCPAGLAPCTN